MAKDSIQKVELAKPYRDGIEFGLGLLTLWLVWSTIVFFFKVAFSLY